MAPKPKKKSKISLDSILRYASGIVSRRGMNGDIALLRLDDDAQYFIIHGVAAEVWLLLNGKRTLGQISTQLAEEHDRDCEDIEINVLEFARNLVKSGLVS